MYDVYVVIKKNANIEKLLIAAFIIYSYINNFMMDNFTQN